MWCWKSSLITNIQIDNSHPQTYGTSATTTDPAFDKPSTIDLLLRQSVYTHILKSRNVKKKTILLTDTVLGSIVSDAADTDHRITKRRHSPQFRIKLLDSQSIIFDSFWEIEDILSSPESQHSSNEIECI